MAVRLPVVVSQSVRRDGHSVDLEESLITELMLAHGLDTTVVTALDTIQFDSTDHLCLQDLGQELILAGWLPLESAQSAWARLQLAGWLQPFGFNSQVGSTINGALGRRIRYLQLTHQTRVDEVIQQLQQMLADRRVKTVSIETLSKSSHAPAATLTQPSPRHTAQPHNQSATAAASDNSSEITKLNSTTPFSLSGVDSESTDWSNLDKLVDELDELDL